MSIQKTLTPKTRIRKGYRYALSRYDRFIDQIHREVFKEMGAPKVFFQYSSRFAHPFIRERMYGKNAPIQWCNESDAELKHVLQFDQQYYSDKTRVIIEPNDSGWTLLQTFGWQASEGTPSMEIIERTKEYLLGNQVAGILVGADDVRSQMVKLYGREVEGKLMDYKMMRTMPVRPWIVKQRLDKLKSNRRDPRFLYVCSHFDLKCGYEVIEAWKRRRSKTGVLTVVVSKLDTCRVVARAQGCRDIEIVSQAPIKRSRLRTLLSEHDVSICTTYTDGGGSAFEAIENGHALLMNSYHRSEYIAGQGNGLVVDAPISYYDYDRYAVEWHDIDTYQKYLQGLCPKKVNRFIDDLASQMDKLLEDYRLVEECSWNSWQVACRESLYMSNLDLRRYYTESVG